MATVKPSRKKLETRAWIVLGVFMVLGFLGCVIALINVQLVHGKEYRELAAQNQLDDSVIPAARGTIYDANMNALAESSSVKKIYVRPSAFKNNYKDAYQEVAKELAKILDVDEEELLEEFQKTDNSHYVVKRRVEYAQVKEVLDFTKKEYTYIDSDGDEQTISYAEFVGTEPDVKRYYSKPLLASSLIGLTNIDGEGLEGLEKKYDSVLAGVPGRLVSAKSANGSDDMPMQYKNVYDPVPGNSIVLTIDEYIQSYLENALQDAYVDTMCEDITGIIMDVKTGAILGMASRGAGYFDLMDPYKVMDEEKAQELAELKEADEDAYKEAYRTVRDRQWRNICVADVYEPGSVFKTVTASALLEEKLVSTTETYTCVGSYSAVGRTYSCHKSSGHGSLNIEDALRVSCNPFFIKHGMLLGVDGFYKYAEAFGFTQRTGIDLPSESFPYFFKRDKIDMSNVASGSFGQSFNITPIQMVTAIACIGNGGKLMQPYIVQKQIDPDGNVVKETKPVVRRQVISEETSKLMRSYMETVVKKGSGKNAYVAGYRVAGKTGTSEDLINNKYWASFACFAPADDPEIAMIIIINNPQGSGGHGGGAVAAPVAGVVLENVLPYLNVEPQYTQEEMEKMEVIAKNVTGMSVREAREKLLADGFTVKVRGEGDTVVSQIPTGGQSVPQKGAIILYTTEESRSETVEMPDLLGLTIYEATNRAHAVGLNIKICGNTVLASEMTAYKQSVEVGEQIPYGTTVTVHFKSNMGISDGPR